MANNKFLDELNLPEGAAIEAVEQKFVALVKERIQAVAETYDEMEVTKEEAWLKNFHKQFFEYVLRWAKDQQAKGKKAGEHPDAVKLKIEAQTTIKAMQDNIIRYASCYMHLNRYLTLLRDEIKSEEIRLGGDGNVLKWTSNTGVAISRYKKQKKAILHQLQQMEEMSPALQEIESCLGRIRSLAEELHNKEKSDMLARSLTAALRTSNFTRAGKLVREAGESKKRFGFDNKNADSLQKNLIMEGRKLVDLVNTNANLLQGPDNKLYLRPSETTIAMDAGRKELKKVRSFLAKYHLPYMQHKVDSVFHLKDKLLVVGSLESLMTLYKKLVTGIALPLEDIKAVRHYECEVIQHVKYLLETQFQEIPRIFERAKENVEEFRSGRAEFEDMAKMNLGDKTPALSKEKAEAAG